MWNIPASMIYVPMHGMRRFLPIYLRVRRAVRGLERAVEENKIFHLWFHPTNLADGIEPMFKGLRQILQHAANLRAEGRLVLWYSAPWDKLRPIASARDCLLHKTELFKIGILV
jgi:hypothetical protein